MQPLSALDSLLIAFSPSLDYLAIATQDGRLRAFETSTGRLLFNISAAAASAAPAGQLAGLAPPAPSEQITCIAWAKGAAAQKAGKKARAAAETELARLHLVVGTALGSVRAYSAATARQAWSASAVNEGGVTALTWAEERVGGGGLMYSVGPDARVVALEAASGRQALAFGAGNHPLRAAAAAPDAQAVLVGSSSLALWGVAEQRRLAKYMGHSLPVRALALSPAGDFALSASSGERQIALWRLPAPGGGGGPKKRQPSAGLLSLEEAAVRIATAPLPGGTAAEGFQVAAVSAAGRAYVWRCSTDGEDGRVAASLAARVDVAGASPSQMAGAEEGLLAADFESASTLLLARGPTAKPTFDRVQLPPAGKAKEAALIHLQPAANGVLLQPGARGGEASTSGKGGAAQQQKKGQVAYVAAEPARAELLRPKLADGTPRAGRKRRAETEEAGTLVEQAVADRGAAEQAGTDALEDGPLLGEPTLGQRLEALQLQARAGGLKAEADGDDAGVRADSVAVLLGQALQAQDKALLEKCLNVANERVIGNSVRRLRAHHAAALLEAAVERLRARANRGAALTAWIRAVLLHHTAYLMAAPGALPILASLSQTIEARTALLKPMAALAGRLDLLVAHLPKPDSGGGAAAEQQPALGGPQVVYVEEDELGAEDPYAAGEESEEGEDADEAADEDDAGEPAEDMDEDLDDLDDLESD